MSISYRRHQLKNGLRLLVHEDFTTPLAACNLIYNVGSRDEDPGRTGIAHLFEHYMFCGSKNIPDYDTPLQKIGALNNAYTGQDHTHYYVILPANNLETALWLESDRMLELAFNQQGLDTQKHVVIEEFKETCLNRPFGDMWSSFHDFVFEKYPYKWMPIGREPAHIETVTMDIMKDFYYRFYRPNNAVLVVGGNVHFEDVVELVEKWFGGIPSGPDAGKHFPTEPEQTAARETVLRREVPFPMLLKAWKMPERTHPDFYGFDLLTDLFGNSPSSYLCKRFVIDEPLFTDISMTVSGTAGPGLVSIVARPNNGVDIFEANRKLSHFLYDEFRFGDPLAHDLQKVKNRNESAMMSSEIKLDSRTSILAVSESISSADDFANDEERYQSVSEEQIQRLFQDHVRPERDCTMFYVNAEGR